MTRRTLQDIATATGYSKATVSLALRNAPTLRESTRQKIQKAAKELDYIPDPAVSKIATYRWNSRARTSSSQIAYVNLRAKPRGALRSRFFAGLGAEATSLGYSLEGFLLKDYPSLEHLARILYNRGVGGIVFSETSLESHENAFTGFPWHRFVTVSCGAGYYRPPIPMIIPDGFSNGNGAVLRLKDAGYRRIGIVFLCRGFTQNDDLQLGGMRHAIVSHFRPRDRVPELFTNYGDSGPFPAWFERHQPEAIICNNPSVLKWLREIGAKASKTPLVCLEVGDGQKSISGWRTRDQEMGRRAIRLLHHQLLTNQVGTTERPPLILVPSPWNPGNTLANPNASKS